MRKFIAKSLIIFGFLCYAFTGYLYVERTNPKRVAFDAVQVAQTEAKEVHSRPIKIRISSINVSLPVYPSSIVGGEWETSSEGVSYLSSSPIPGEKGNSVMYGHNWKNLLADLPKVKPGDTIEIMYEDGSVKTFDVEYTVEVKPNATSILAPSKDRRITLYTCTGFLDSKRFVVVGIAK